MAATKGMRTVKGADGIDRNIYTIYLVNPHGEYGADPRAAARMGNRATVRTVAGESDEECDRLAEIIAERYTPEALEGMGRGEENGYIGYAGSMDFGYVEAIQGPAWALSSIYTALLGDLASPAWHWYGMGGDDHCYDYWPNSMQYALEFLDALRRVAEIEVEAGNILGFDERGLRDMEGDLNRVYWLCRVRYAREKVSWTGQAIEGNDEDGDAYFESEILGHDSFGECPDWLK